MARTIHTRCTYGVFGRGITKYTIIPIRCIYTVLANPRFIINNIGMASATYSCDTFSTVTFKRSLLVSSRFMFQFHLIVMNKIKLKSLTSCITFCQVGRRTLLQLEWSAQFLAVETAPPTNILLQALCGLTNALLHKQCSTTTVSLRRECDLTHVMLLKCVV